MHRILALPFLFVSAFCSAQDNSFRAEVLSGYSERCHEVMSQKGFPDNEIQQVCACETAVVDENFSTFTFIAMGIKQASGEAPMSKQQITDLRRQIRQCKN